MSCNADLPFVGTSAAVKAGKRGKAADRQKRRSALCWTFKKIPSWEGGPRSYGSRGATAVAEPDGVGGCVRVTTHPREGIHIPSKVELRPYLNDPSG